MPEVSVIVPVYNTESYLRECIESILRQSYTDFEVLLVDDGSTDDSGAICDEYAKKDNRIKVIHTKNMGVSSARNIGLDNAIGNWIIFADADDELYKDALNLRYDDFEKHDLVLGSYYECSHETFRLQSLKKNRSENIKIYLSDNIQQGIFSVVWGKFYKRNLIGNIRFDTNMTVGEDTHFLLRYLRKVKSFIVINKPLYIYNQPSNLQTKYRMSVPKSIYALNKIFKAYYDLDICAIEFEKRIFTDYKTFCQDNIQKKTDEWYKNKNIEQIYGRIKHYMSWKYRCFYFLMSFQFLSDCINKIRKKKDECKTFFKK